jgi:nicotinate-nucleotide adenylyltransferase
MPDSHRIGVFGGTFDPVHVGHLIVADVIRHDLRLDEIIFLPAGRPPHKPGQQISSDDDRLTMLRLSTEKAPAFTISRIDIDRAGASYTADSLAILRETVPSESDLYFMMGQDSLRDFPTWHRPDAIVRQARLAVALRPGVVVHPEDVERSVPETVGRIEIIPVPLIGISSRDLRATVRSGGAYRFQVMPEVADYIEDRRLYRD